MNKLWRAGETLVAYVDDTAVIAKIRRSHPDFIETSQYYDTTGHIFARQYNVPSARKRSARNLLGVNVDR